MKPNGLRWVTVLFFVALAGWFWAFRIHPSGLAPVTALATVPHTTSEEVIPRAVRVPAKAPVVSESQGKVALLQEILASRNDNDPRLDSEFRNLDPAAKAALVGYYSQLPTEDANGRGTVVFLLGREITRQEDLVFFTRVLAEKIPKLPPTTEGSLPMGLLAAYPQVMAVTSLRNTRERTGDETIRRGASEQLNMAAENPNTEISRRAKLALQTR